MNILISGCGIAGITAAIYLERTGHHVTIIDRTTSPQHRGHGLSLKGFGVEIVKQLGLYDKLVAKEILITQYTTFDATGRFIRRFPRALIDQSTGRTIAVSRADLHEILFKALPACVEKRYNSTITSLSASHDGVIAMFNDRPSTKFDIVIIAEGIRSSTRRLLWNDEGEIYFDLAYAAGVVNLDHGIIEGEAETFKGVDGNISFFPVSKHQVAVQASFRDKSGPGMMHSKKNLIEHFSGFTKKVTDLLARIDEKNKMYFDKAGMVNIDKFFKGRVVLLGDAAHCPSFLSGMGASLSMLGAKLLAYQINNQSNPEQAFIDYDKIMRPLATHFRENALINMRREIPSTPRAERITKLIMKYIPVFLIKRAVRKQLLEEAELMGQILSL